MRALLKSLLATAFCGGSHRDTGVGGAAETAAPDTHSDSPLRPTAAVAVSAGPRETSLRSYQAHSRPPRYPDSRAFL